MSRSKLSKGIAKLYGVVPEPIQPKGTIDDKLNDIIRRLERIECFLHQVRLPESDSSAFSLRKYEDAMKRTRKILRKV